MFAALISAGMISVTSCADYDEDIRALQNQVDEHTTIQNALQTQVNGMQGQIAALEDALKALKSCQCGDIDARIAEQISKALAGLNYATPEDVAAAIEKALAGINTGMTNEEVQALIEAYHNAHPSCTCGDIKVLIEQYLKENPGLSEADVLAIVKAYHDAHPGSSLTENDVKALIETYINNLQHFTKEQIEAMINTAITQALANYVSCNCDSYTKAQVDDLIKAAIEKYAATDSHGLTQEQVQALIDAAIAKIQHPESGLSKAEVDALIAAAITEALKDVTKGLATEEYVKGLVEQAKCDCPALTSQDVTNIATTVIEQYMQQHPYVLDTEAVKNIANAAIENSVIINNIKNSITTLQTTLTNVQNELENLKNNVYTKDEVYTKDDVYTKAEVEALINTLIQQSIKNCNCDNSVLSPEQSAIIAQLISAAIEQYNNAHPDCNCQYDAAAFASLVAQVTANSEAIAGIVIPVVPDVSGFITNEQLQQAINGVKELIPAEADLSNYVTVATLNEQITIVNGAIAEAQSKAAEAYNKASDALNIANQAYNTASSNTVAINNLQTTVNNLNNLYVDLSTQLTETTKKAEAALDRSLSNYYEILTLKQLYKQLLEKVNGLDDLSGILAQLDNFATKAELNTAVTTLEGKIQEAREYAKQEANDAAAAALIKANNYTDTQIADVKKLYEEADKKLQNQINTINSSITTINGRLDTLEQDMEQVKKVVNYVTKLITSIELQGTHNQAFGAYMLPIGVQSNILIAYYGENEHDTYFPAIDDYDLVYQDAENWITADDYRRLGVNDPWSENWSMTGGTTFLDNQVLDEDKGYAGKIYLTVNPSSVDFTNTQFKLVNSIGEESAITLDRIAPCTDKLTFGNTRALTNANNGFYAAEAYVSADNLNSVKYGVSKQLTDALEDVAKNKLNANLSNLAQGIFNQLNGSLDAYAVQASWTDDLGEHSVTSKYGIAATAVKPLSYSFMYGQSLKLPYITPLSELNINLKDYIDLSKFSYEVKKEDIGVNIKFDFSDISIDEHGNVVTDIVLIEKNKDYEEASFPVILISADGWYEDPVTHEKRYFPGYNRDVAAWVAQIITNRADSWGAQLSKEFEDNIDKLIQRVNDVTASGGKLQSTLDTLLDRVQGMLSSTLSATDPIINGLNSVLSSLNMYLENPNLRLQTHLMFEGTDGFFHPMSTSAGWPSTFVKDGGEGINLYINSYTGEYLVPSYKKFVAVTNVYKDGKDADSDPALMKALKKANSVEYFNEVIPGNRYAVVFAPDKSISDATYEIVYSSLDYHGKISQRKYFVTVK